MVIRIRPKIFLKPLELFYYLALKAVILSLKKHHKVSAIYICGSLAQSAILPALSDIDLKVFLQGKKDSVATAKILKTFSCLRLFFPMISISEEIGIHFLGDFYQEHNYYPLLKHLFDQRFHPRKLVWGEDVLAGRNLIPSTKDDFYPSCLWRFKYWFEKLTCLYSTNALNQAQKRYLFYKAIADICLIYLIMNDPNYSYKSRDQTLRDIEEILSGRERALIPKLVQERKALFTKGSFDLNEAFLAFKNIVSFCCDNIERASGQEVVERPVEFYGNNITSDQDIIDQIQEALGIQFKVIVLPSSYLATSPLDYETFALPAYFILPEHSLKLEQLDALRTLYRKCLIDKISLFIKENDYYVYSAYSYFMDHVLEARFNGLATFNLLLSNPKTYNNKMQFNIFCLELLKKRLVFYIEQLEAIVRNKDIYKMDPSSYFKFFFSSLSKLILYRSIILNKFHLITDPAAIADYLISNLSISDMFINRMVEHYLNLKSSGSSNHEPIFGQSVKFLECFRQVVINKKAQDELINLSRAEFRAKMLVSVIIVTKSHVGQLMRCLLSLAQLNRTPDEVIVVDNDSMDSTKETVLQFKGPFDLRYVCYSGFGIGKVRNAGIREANGDILVFVDDDAVVDQDWLANLEKEFIKNPYLGICGGSIRNMPMDRDDLVYRYFSMMDLM